jgi:hypothetical protein
MIHIKLPNRREITLCEAITAFIYGEPRDVSSAPPYPSFSLDNVLELLHEAAQAGRIIFRALRVGINKYQEIDPGYFNKEYSFDWRRNLIQGFASRDEVEDYVGEYDIVPVVEWHDVYLNRNQYASLLKDMGVSVEPSSDSDASDKSKIYNTGLPGRSTAKQLALPIAERRLANGDYPDTKKGFAEQIVDAVRKAEPQAPPMTAKTLTNDPKFSELWRRKPQRPK